MADKKPSPYKLKNPTEYHLLATQNQLGHQEQQQIDSLEDHHIGFSDYYTQQQFLSPSSTSPPLQDFDDMDSLSNNGISIISTSVIGDMMIVPDQQQQQQQQFFFPSQQFPAEESPSDYSSSLDLFSHNSQPTSYMELHNRQNSISSGCVTIHQDALSLAASPPMLYNNRLSSSLGDHQPFSAPAHMGYDILGGHMGGLAYQHQPPDSNIYSNSLAATGSRSLEEYECIQIK
jgi:hypothetical protein